MTATVSHALRVMVLMMLADEDVDADELARIREIHASFGGSELGDADVRAEVERARAEGGDVEAYLGAIAGTLSEEERARILRCAFRVACADGFVLEEEEQLLARIGAALGFEAAQTREVLDAMMPSMG